MKQLYIRWSLLRVVYTTVRRKLENHGQEQGVTHEDSRDSRIFTLEDDLHAKHKRDISQGIPSVARTVIEKENSLLVDQRVKSTLNFVDKISRRDNCNFLKRQRFYFTSCLQLLLYYRDSKEVQIRISFLA